MDDNKNLKADVFFHVQHLLGTGHFYRSVAIANSLAREGLSVVIVSGGMPLQNTRLENVTLLQLPPFRARGGEFADLVDEHDCRIDDSWRQHRMGILMEYWQRYRPSVLITESYPFARRMLRHELLQLLQSAQQESFCKLAICSVRDIPQPKSMPGRNAEAIAVMERYYDHLLVHGDPSLATLTEIFPEAHRIAPMTHYTGYVDSSTGSDAASPDRADVLVSTGGGATGLFLYLAAIEAAQLNKHLIWRLLIGNYVSQSDYEAMCDSAGKNVIVERNRPDFQALLKASTVSVSQAGYNTAVDVVRSGAKCVLVPYAGGKEKEQSIRAAKMANSGRVVVVPENLATGQALLDAVEKATNTVLPEVHWNFDGAEISTRLITGWMRGEVGEGLEASHVS